MVRRMENGIAMITRSTTFDVAVFPLFKLRLYVPSELRRIPVSAVFNCTVPSVSAAAIACGSRSLPPAM